MKKGDLLKLTAISLMTLDHVAVAFSTSIPVFWYWCLRGAGRIVFPVFCYCVASGFIHTRNEKNYIFRMLLFALLSEIPFNLLCNNTLFFPASQNTLFTLSAALCCLYILKHYNNSFSGIICLAIAVAAQLLGFDYGAFGVILVIAIYLFKDERLKLYLISLLILALIGIQNGINIMLLECIGILGIPLAKKLNSKANLKYLFYIYYPCHMLLIFLLRRII